MKTTRRFLGAAAIAALYTLSGPAATAWAQDAPGFPARPIKIMLGFPPGGSTDSPVRVLAEDACKSLKQRVVTDNKAAAAGLMPAQVVQGAPATGYTVGVIPAYLFRLLYTGNID